MSLLRCSALRFRRSLLVGQLTLFNNNTTGTLFDSISTKQSEALATNLTTQEIANTVWSFATLGHASDRLFDAVAGQSLMLIQNANLAQIASIIWSYAISNSLKNADGVALVTSLWELAITPETLDNASESELRQVSERTSEQANERSEGEQ